MRRFALPLLLLWLLSLPLPALADAPVRLVINGVEIRPDVPPMIQDGRTLVPIRFLAEPLGFAVAWDGDTGTVTLSGPKVIQLTVGRDEAVVDGAAVVLDAPAVNVGGRVLIPLRFVAEQLGAEVGWDGESRTVAVSAPWLPAEAVVNPAVLAALGEPAWLVGGRAFGDFTVTMEVLGAELSGSAQFDAFRDGEDFLVLVRMRADGLGLGAQTGVATVRGRTWVLGRDGSWEPQPPEAPVQVPMLPEDGLGASLRVGLLPFGAEALASAQVSRGEEVVDGVVYDVTTVSLDEAAVRAWLGEAAATLADAGFSATFWAERGTGLLKRADLALRAEDPLGTVFRLHGSLHFEPWAQPIPFPPEILAESRAEAPGRAPGASHCEGVSGAAGPGCA
ncbi:hypothetical protein J2Z79_000163 [Symbiobacterium terraclitae]|uniref:Copper amine oxidase-like N-terminal domain-containing protein n=1 Tax=Symbiobacterium terraclitae TaxID=557451 RepID=A0ABS4JML4_9FIRM|nr:copper amine oxidase N-terminal domain-containing protein [Symbiobacterium terraclitae]MBP2016790.1 hypothetical protein [Symbiobacterium terraclitae]